MVHSIAGADSRIRYQRNAQRQGCMGNYAVCLGLARGVYIKYLNDDDWLDPECVARMVSVFESQPDVTLVTSRRRCIDDKGRARMGIISSWPIVLQDCVIDGVDLASVLIRETVNLVGEPSTAMFRREDAAGLGLRPLSFAGRDMPGIGDIAMWVKLLSRGDAVFLKGVYSAFRIHPGQRQAEKAVQLAGIDSKRYLGIHGLRLGLVREGVFRGLHCHGLDESRWYRSIYSALWVNVWPVLRILRRAYHRLRQAWVWFFVAAKG
jgi:hypothetical protein